VEGVTEMSEIHDRLSRLLRPLVAEAEAEADSESRLLIVRVRLRGSTALHMALRSDRDKLSDDVEATLQHSSQEIWLEQLIIETAEPVELNSNGHPALDTFDLRSTLETIESSSALRAEAEELVAELVRKLPAGASEETIPDCTDIESLISESGEILLHRSAAGQGGPA
jgi:hypothetical protein